METKDAILELQRYLNLSQNEFAERLFVTRQAVSRQENGDTIPDTGTLKLIAKTFDVSVDYLLGLPIGQCQSCGMILVKNSDKGTECDGSKSEEYCTFCYHNLLDLDNWNRTNGLDLTKQEARTALLSFLPSLKRWKKENKPE